MRILTWNLALLSARRPPLSTDRARRLVNQIESKDAAIIALVEIDSHHQVVLEELRSRGFHLWPDRSPQGLAPEADCDVLIASRLPLAPMPGLPFGPTLRERLVEAQVADLGISLTVVHVPDANPNDPPSVTAKDDFWMGLLQLAEERLSLNHLILGDFNTGDNRLDKTPRGVKFSCSERFKALGQRGWTDLWREQQASKPHTDNDFTYWSLKRDQTGLANGFRLDHIHVSPSLRTGWQVEHVKSVRENWYGLAPGSDPDSALSDHSMVIASRVK